MRMETMYLGEGGMGAKRADMQITYMGRLEGSLDCFGGLGQEKDPVGSITSCNLRKGQRCANMDRS